MDLQDNSAAGFAGCVARRRAAYTQQIATRSTMTSRLAATDVRGMMVAA
jgi:RNA polymerase sigma factor for flagellar operon FliA